MEYRARPGLQGTRGIDENANMLTGYHSLSTAVSSQLM